MCQSQTMSRRKFLLRLDLLVLSLAVTILNCRTVETRAYRIPLVYSGGSSYYQSDGLSGNPDGHHVQGEPKKVSVLSSAILQEDRLGSKPGQGYYISVNIGTPPQTLNVLVDTGSSNFAVAAAPHPLINKHFHINESQSFKQLGTDVFVPYTQGSWAGSLGNDRVVIPSASDSIAADADVACIFKSEKFFINGSNWQGILGLAYPAIARPNSTVTPFLDVLVSSKRISNVFSLQLCGQNNAANSSGGTMILGGIDPALYWGEITYAPLLREWYYEVVLTEVRIGDIPVPVSCQELNADKTIVDSGTTNLRLPRKVFSQVVETFKRQVALGDPIPDEFWTGESVMCWVSGTTPWRLFPKVLISIARSWNSTFALKILPQQYLRKVGDADATSENRNCYKFAINPSDSGSVLGTVVMEGFYVVFDRQNRRVGFAMSTCGFNSTEGYQPIIVGPFSFTEALQCAYYPPSTSADRVLTIVACVMIGLCAICLVPMLALMCHKWVVDYLNHRDQRHLRCHQGDTATLVECE